MSAIQTQVPGSCLVIRSCDSLAKLQALSEVLFPRLWRRDSACPGGVLTIKGAISGLAHTGAILGMLGLCSLLAGEAQTLSVTAH